MRKHRCMRLCALVGAGALGACLLASPAGAQSAADKLGRGVAGMTTGILELPGNMIAETDERGAAEGVPIGFAKGLGMVVARELVGVYEFLTAPLAVPHGYRPVLKPDYPWDY